MPLCDSQKATLYTAIEEYKFPPVYWDYINSGDVELDDTRELEDVLRPQLVSDDTETVRRGLANVTYWGYAKSGGRQSRAGVFYEKATEEQLIGFQQLVADQNVPTLVEIKQLKLPQYSGISFVSKILAFLSPHTHCVLDSQLLRLTQTVANKAITQIELTGQIKISAHNEAVYDQWRQECSEISERYYYGAFRAVDIERGFFSMIQNNGVVEAQEIYAAA